MYSESILYVFHFWATIRTITFLPALAKPNNRRGPISIGTKTEEFDEDDVTEIVHSYFSSPPYELKPIPSIFNSTSPEKHDESIPTTLFESTKNVLP